MRSSVSILKRCSKMESKGLVVMFGWTGAKQRHVENHAKIWTRLGFDGTS